MKLASIFFEHLPVSTEQRERPEIKGRLIGITQIPNSDGTIVDISSQEQQQRNTGFDMPLDVVSSNVGNVVFLGVDTARYQRSLSEVLDTLEQYGLDVEEASVKEIYVRLDNAEAMYGGEQRLLAILLHSIPTYLMPRIGIGSTKLLASVAAYHSKPWNVFRVPRDAAKFLASLTIDILPLRSTLNKKLHSFGLHTIGQISAIGVGPLQAQFGASGKIIWEFSRGIDTRLLLPRKHEDSVTESIILAAPVSSMEALVVTIDILLDKVFRHKEMWGRYARVCCLQGSMLWAPTWEKRMIFREPIKDRKQALSLIKYTLEGHPPPGPLEDLQLTLTGLTGEIGKQTSLFRGVRQKENLREMLEQLETRLGQKSVIYSIREVEPWSKLPERRRALVPYIL